MGGNRRNDRKRKKKGEDEKGASSPKSGDDGTKEQNNDDGVIVHLESSSPNSNGSESSGDNNIPPSAWSVEFTQNIGKNTPDQVINADDIPSVNNVGLQMVRGTLQKIASKNRKKRSQKENETVVKATPIQLRFWPALLNSFESKSCAEPSAARLNAVGIAPTGSGKTMAYAVPIISHCVRTLLCQQLQTPKSKQSTQVHGLVIVPTRELAIQVAKEFKVVAKVANKYLAKCAAVDEGDAADASSMKVGSMAVYGGVDIALQISSILGKDDDSSNSLVVSATAGRLLDILKQSDDSNKELVTRAFANLQAIVFDEADRIAVNADMAGAVDEILAILKDARVNNGVEHEGGEDVVTCLVSATLPEKAEEMCEKWVPRSRIVVKIDSAKVGEKKRVDPPDATKTVAENSDAGDGGSAKDSPDPDKSADDGKKKHALQNIDYASIPSNIVQTLHVCSGHKKPKKLILTLQRIYMNKEAKGGRFSANNRLCIVFFAQIATLKYVSKLLFKEGLRCNELYGSLDQSERERRLMEFRCGKTPILLATDVAARGLHINNVHFVVNYDFPGSLDQYVHRCGRAGRKQSLSGEVDAQYPPTVYSFFERRMAAMADSTVELLESCNAWVDPNLLALTSQGKAAAKSSNKDRKRKRKINKSPETETKTAEDNEAASDNEDQFAFLGKSKLKRASHVSDAEDSDEESS